MKTIPEHLDADQAAAYLAAPDWQQGTQAAMDALAYLHRKQAAPEGITGLRTGIHELDVATGGMELGRVWTIAARPGVGKTAMAGQIIRNNAEAGIPVAFLTLEQPKEQIVLRMALGRAGLSVRQAIANKANNGKIMHHLAEVGKMPVHYLDGPAKWKTIEDSAPFISAMGIKLLVIDYLQLLDRSEAMRSRVDVLGEITANMKTFAKECGITVLALAQVNRSGDASPTMSNLKDAGSIEQDADVVILLHRDPVNGEDGKPSGQLGETGNIIIAKNRDGTTGALPATFKGETFTWITE